MNRSIIRILIFGVVLFVFTSWSFNENAGDHHSSLMAIAGMHEARASHTATLLPNGNVLIAGGFKKGADGYSQIYFKSAEIYDPRTRSFTSASAMKFSRCGHTATLLQNGKVLVAGGYGDSGLLSSAELYDPADNSWNPLPAMNAPREGHTATLLRNGMVLIAGGGEERITPTADLFDPRTNTFERTGDMHEARAGHTAALLQDGRVIIIGGATQRGKVLSTAERYDPSDGSFSPFGTMSVPRYKHATISLEGGEILVLGGSNERDWRGKYNTAELADNRNGTFSVIDTMHERRFKFPQAVVAMPTGDVVIAGGGPMVEVYLAKTKSFITSNAFDESHYYGTATLLRDGSILITGGYNSKPQSANNAWVFKYN